MEQIEKILLEINQVSEQVKKIAYKDDNKEVLADAAKQLKKIEMLEQSLKGKFPSDLLYFFTKYEFKTLISFSKSEEELEKEEELYESLEDDILSFHKNSYKFDESFGLGLVDAEENLDLAELYYDAFDEEFSIHNPWFDAEGRPIKSFKAKDHQGLLVIGDMESGVTINTFIDPSCSGYGKVIIFGGELGFITHVADSFTGFLEYVLNRKKKYFGLI